MKRILIVYHSQEKGNTRKMAELVAKGCREVAGVQVELVNTHETRASVEAAEKADAYALGSPDYYSYMAGGLKMFFDDLCLASWARRDVTHKPYVAFLTHGGGGSAINSIESLARSLKLEQAAPSVVCQGAPAGEAVEKCIQLGRTLAECVVGQGS